MHTYIDTYIHMYAAHELSMHVCMDVKHVCMYVKHVCMYVCMYVCMLGPLEVPPPLTNPKTINYRSNTKRFP